MEDIKILEEMIKARKDHMKNYEKSGCYTNIYFTLKAEVQAIENLINRNKDLEERNIYLVNERKKLEELLFMSNENYIEKSKVKETIEERRERLIKGKRSYTNKIRINELNLISKKLLED